MFLGIQPLNCVIHIASLSSRLGKVFGKVTSEFFKVCLVEVKVRVKIGVNAMATRGLSTHLRLFGP